MLLFLALWKSKASSSGLIAKDRGKNIDRQGNDGGVKNKRQQPMKKYQSPETAGGDTYIGHLEGHTDHKGEINKIQKIRLLIPRKLQSFTIGFGFFFSPGMSVI